MSAHLMLLAMFLWQGASSPSREWYLDLLPLFTALIGVGATTLGLFLGPKMNRRVAKKGPKTEIRARAYEEFVAYHLRPELHEGGAVAHGPELSNILARLLVFGESGVIAAVAEFLGTPRERRNLTNVIVKMRASVMTGEAKGSIKILLDHLPPPREAEAPPAIMPSES
jgi:hypothetical protein